MRRRPKTPDDPAQNSVHRSQVSFDSILDELVFFIYFATCVPSIPFIFFLPLYFFCFLCLKTLRNALRGVVGEDAIAAAGLDASARPETLSVSQFAALAAATPRTGG